MKTWHLLAAWAMAISPWAAAQPHPGPGDLPPQARAATPLARAFESAWQRSVESAQARGRFARAHAEREAAASLLGGPPTVEVEHLRGTGGSTARESEAALALPLRLPSERGARGAAADADLAVAEAASRALRLAVAGELREAAWQLAAAGAEAAAERANADGLEALAADVERRVQAGDLARSDAMAASAELLAARASLAQALARQETARSQWTLLTGVAPVEQAAEPDPPAPVPDHPALVLARETLARAHREVELVRATRRDPIEVSVRLRRETSDANLPAESAVGLGVKIPFGGAVRNAPRDAAALAELDTARAEEARTARRLEAESRNARAALELAQRRLEAERARSGLLRSRAQLIDKSFHAGESPLPELLRARAAAAQSDAALARQHAELGLARARLLQALGVLP